MSAPGIVGARLRPAGRARRARTRRAGAGEFSTFGWDTAFAVRIENVNAAIRARHSPLGFEHHSPNDPQAACSGKFGDWQVVRGGDGGHVNILLPLREIAGRYRHKTGYVPYTCAAATITVSVRLRFVEAGGSTRHLLIDPHGAGPDDPVVSLYARDFGLAPVEPPSGVYSIQAAVVDWCQDHLAEFAHVFAAIDLNDAADTGAWAFLKPTAVSYAYVDGPDDADAFLGVLAVTGGQSTDGLQQVLDDRIVAAGEQGAFCISRDLLLRRVIQPQLLHGWPNLRAQQLAITENAIQLVPNTTVALPQTTYQDQPYTPHLKDFTLTCEGSQITVEGYTETQVQDGVTAWCRTTARYTIGKGTNKQGRTTLLYRQLGRPQTTNGHYIDESVEITDAILAAVLALGVAALAVVTGGGAAVVIAIVGALIVGGIALSPQIAALIEGGDAPAIDLLQLNITDPTTWTDSHDFAIDAVDLDGSLRLGGALGFTAP